MAAFHSFNCSVRAKFPYFKREGTIFEDADAVKPDSSSLFCFHPHGILCCGWSVNGNLNKHLFDANVHFMGTDALFVLPGISDDLSWHNCGPASKKNMLDRMSAEQNLALIPGGFEEATFYRYGKHRVFLRNRKGFVKYALQNGYKLFPVYTFGEERTFWVWSWLMEKLVFLNKYKIPAVVFLGKYGFMPNDGISCITVVGAPLQLPKIEAPTSENIDFWHKQYIESLQDTFDKYKEKYAHEGKAAKLEII